MKGILVTAFGILILALGEVIYWRMRKCKEEVVGKVVKLQEYKGNIKWSLFTTVNLIVEYTYNGTLMRATTLNAMTYFTQTMEKKLAAKGYAIGSECKIKVNKDKPEDICSAYKRSGTVTLGGILFIVFGILMIKSGY